MNGLILAGLLISTIGAPLYAANSDSKVVVDITKSSVGVDLKALLHDETPFDNLPSLSTSSTTNFRYLGSVPSNGSIYVYYVSNSDLTSLSADIGTSLNADYSITKNIQSYSPILVNSYTNGSCVFYKKVISGAYIYTVGNQHRFDVVKVGSYNCDNDLSWEDTASGKDRIYDYYKDNYVVVNSKLGVLDCVPFINKDNALSSTNAGTICPNAAHELFYCFFSLGETSSTRSISNCIGVDYGYTSYSYSYYYRSQTNAGSRTYACSPYLGTDTVYESPIDGTCLAGADYSAIDYKTYVKTYALPIYERGVVDGSMTSATYSGNKHAAPGSTTISDIDKSSSIPALMPWETWRGDHQLNYSYENLVKLDDASIYALSDESFKGFLTRNRGDYDFAFLVDSSVRNLASIDNSFNNPFDALTVVKKVVTTCHGLSQIQLFKLTFKDNLGTFDLNAIDEPTDITVVDNAYDAQTILLPPVGWWNTPGNWWDKFLKWLTEFGTKLGIGLACTIGLIGVIWIIYKAISIKTQSASISRSLAKREKKKD